MSYTDLPDVVRYNDQKIHKKFKHGYISRNVKASINEQLSLSYKNGDEKRIRSGSNNLYMYDSSTQSE